jgi:bifunctional non-homologous end joining protein LigD
VVALRNPDRVVYGNMNFTKREVVEFYRSVAPYLVPHLKQHPVTLKRYPDQTHGMSFWEKDAPSFTPKWVKTFGVWRRSGEAQIHYIVIDSARTLEWAASVGTLEIHPFLARVPDIEQPASVVFDLDPGEGIKVPGAARVALLLRELLARLGLQSFAKVSGVKGIQVYVPLNTPVTYAVTQPFAKTVAELLHAQNPELIVASMARSERGGRVFIDWSQNADYKTTVSVYSLRAKRHRPHVSMPVVWEELGEAAESGESSKLYWLAESALERLAEVGDLFAPVLTLKQTLPPEFLQAVSTVHTVKPRVSRGKVGREKASEQGGRRTFVLSEDAMVLDLGEVRYAWKLAGKLPWKAKEKVEAEQVPAPGRSVRHTDDGTFELIEGNFDKGYADLHFSGKTMRGEYTFVRNRDGEWTLTKGFVPWKAL